MRILFLAHLFPLPLDSGGKIKSYHTLRALASRHEVHLVAYVREKGELDRVTQLQEFCSVETVPLRRGRSRHLMELGVSLASGEPFIVKRDFRADMQRAVSAAVGSFRPDVVHIDHLQMAQFVDFDGPYQIVLDHHNVESTIIRRLANTPGSALKRVYAQAEWPKLLSYELQVCRSSDLVLTVSEEDKRTLLDLEPRAYAIECVPIGVDTDYFAQVMREPDSKNILSIGAMHWPPNIDSMLYFAREILPLVRNQAPDCTLTIAGQKPSPEIRALAADRDIRVTGYVSDVRECARDCGVFVVPLRSGSGVRVKILNAMAMGLPVVSTSVGAEGLHLTDGEDLLIADSPEQFARAVADVLRSPELADRLGRHGQATVRRSYSWQSASTRLLDIYAERLEQPQRCAYSS